MSLLSKISLAGVNTLKYTLAFFGLLMLAFIVNNVIHIESATLFFFLFRCLSLGVIILVVPLYFGWKNTKQGAETTLKQKKTVKSICYQLVGLFVVFEILIAWRG